VTPERLKDSKEALGWFAAEYTVLLASVRLAAEKEFDECAWQIPWTMRHFQDWQGHWHDWAALQPLALAAATRLGDVAGQAVTCRLAASACDRIGDDVQARTRLTTALRLYRQLGDRIGEARTHQGLGLICEAQQRYDEGLEHDEQALALFRAAGHRLGQAQILNNLGYAHIQLGNPQRGRAYCRQGLTLSRELGDRVGEAHAWDSLGFAEHELERNKQAASCYRRAIRLHNDPGHRFMQAWTLDRLGDACNAIPDAKELRVPGGKPSPFSTNCATQPLSKSAPNSSCILQSETVDDLRR
jgi:tetratricopeptide (TPR) repeat protein